MNRSLGRPLAYTLAAALTLVTLAIRLALRISGDEPLLELFLVPIILSAYLGGGGPGLFATALAALLSNYILLPPVYSFSLTVGFDTVGWVSLLVVGTLVSLLNIGLHRARRRTEVSQRLHAITLDSIGDAVITTDAQGRITFLNTEAERLTGWSNAEGTGQPLAAVFRIVNAHTRAPVEDPAAQVLRSGAVVALANQTMLIDRAGHETPIDDSGAPIRHADGRVEGMVLVFRDVTAREQAEVALRESQERLTGIVGSAMDAIISIGPAQRIVVFNSAAEQIFGCPAAAALGQPLDRFVPLRFRDIHGAHIHAFGQTGVTSRSMHSPGTLTALRADGTEFPIEATISQTMAAGQPLYTVIMRDISARIQAEAALQRSAERMKLLADASRAFAEMGVDYQTLLDRITRHVSEVLGDLCGIRLLSDDGVWLTTAAVYAADPEALELWQAAGAAIPVRADALPIFQSVLQSGQAQLVPVIHQAQLRAAVAPEYWPSLERLGDHSRIVAPLRNGAQSLGILGIARHRRDRPPFDENDVRLAQDLADRAALAISNARLYQDVQVELERRREAERSLRASEEWLRLGYDAAGLGIWRHDIPAGMLHLDLPAREHYGCAANDVALADLLACVHPDDITRLGEEIAVTMLPSGSGRYATEYRVIHPNGAIHWLAVQARVIFEGEGVERQPVLGFGTSQDITERKRAELALRQSEERFAIAFRANPAAMSITRLHDGCFIDINASHERLFGYQRDELIGQHVGAIDMYAQANQRAQIVQIMREQGSLHEAELTLRTKAGELREVLCSLEALEIDGEAYILGIVFDITDRKRAEQVLQRSAERLKVLADASRAFAEVGTEYQALLDQVARTITKVLGEGCFIRLLSHDEVWLPLVALYDLEPEKLALQRIILGETPLHVDELSLTTSIFQSRQPLLVPVVDREQVRAATKPEYWSLVDRLGIHTLLGVPMRAQGQVIGVLIIYRRLPEQPAFDEDDLSLVQDLADRAALAIINARLLQRVQHELAQRASAEVALRESEERLRAVTDTAQVGLVIVDQEHRYRYANPAYADIFHLPTAELVGQRVADVLAPVYEAQIRPRLQRAFGGEQVSYELVVPPEGASAQERHYAVTYQPGLYHLGLVVVVVVVDITARKQAEEQLRYQANLLEQISDAIISTDASYTIKSWNAAAEALYGWSAQEVIGKSMREIVPTTYPDSDARQVQALFLRDEHWRGEVVQQWRDGTQRSILSGVNLIKDHAGNLVGAVAVNRDITDRKRAEQALQRSADRLRVLADASRAFAEIGAEYQAVLDQVARTTAEVLGEGCAISLVSEDGLWLQRVAIYDVDPEKLELLHPVLSDTQLSADQPSLTGQVFKSSQPLFMPVIDPEQVPAAAKQAYAFLAEHLGIHSMLSVPMRAQGRTIGVLTLFRHRLAQLAFSEDDLTLAQDLADRAALAISSARLFQQVQAELAERTKAEAEVRTLSIELEQRVADRTAALATANKELEAFSYSVSHDLRAPLRAIDGFARILLEDYIAGLPDEAQRYFQLMRTSAQQMGRLIDDLLAFARLSRQPLSRRAVDCAALVRQCLDELHAEQAGRRVTISIGALPACAGDPALLKQVWINLLANALKYSRRRDPALIEIASRAEGDETIYFVSDNGVGFDMRYNDKLFGVFQRMHRAEDYEGTGVGLAIVQRIVHRHGGRIWAEAAVERGATFFFTLGDPLL